MIPTKYAKDRLLVRGPSLVCMNTTSAHHDIPLATASYLGRRIREPTKTPPSRSWHPRHRQVFQPPIAAHEMVQRLQTDPIAVRQVQSLQARRVVRKIVDRIVRHLVHSHQHQPNQLLQPRQFHHSQVRQLSTNCPTSVTLPYRRPSSTHMPSLRTAGQYTPVPAS